MLTFILNLPYTFAGIIYALVCRPIAIRTFSKPYCLIFNVKNYKNRACTIGHTIILTPKILKNDLKHELIHVQQYERYPVIFPILYYYESFKKGYRKNRFEDEAYTLSKSYYQKN